jgi:hypothetical protein
MEACSVIAEQKVAYGAFAADRSPIQGTTKYTAQRFIVPWTFEVGQ